MTAYDHERAALDDLLKPFDNGRFDRAFRRGVELIRHKKADPLTERLEHLLDASERAHSPDETTDTYTSEATTSGGLRSGYLERGTVDLPGTVRVIPVEKIRYITAEDAFVRLHMADNSSHVHGHVRVTEERLNPPTSCASTDRPSFVSTSCRPFFMDREVILPSA